MRRSASRWSLYEPELARAEAGRDRIAGNLQRAVDKGRLDAADRDATIARITPTDDAAAAADSDLVVEAVFEDLGVKSALWRQLDGIAPAGDDLRLEHELDRDPPARRVGVAANDAAASSGCTSSARCRSCRSSS